MSQLMDDVRQAVNTTTDPKVKELLSLHLQRSISNQVIKLLAFRLQLEFRSNQYKYSISYAPQREWLIDKLKEAVNESYSESNQMYLDICEKLMIDPDPKE